MACWLCSFFQGSRTWLVGLVVIPISALFATFFSLVSTLAILISSLFLLTTLAKWQKPIEKRDQIQTEMQESPKSPSKIDKIEPKNKGFLTSSQDSYSETESSEDQESTEDALLITTSEYCSSHDDDDDAGEDGQTQTNLKTETKRAGVLVKPQDSYSETERSKAQESTDNALLITSSEYCSSHDDDDDGQSQTNPKTEPKHVGFLVKRQDLYSESESNTVDQCSSISSEDHFSDIEWPYNMGQRLLDCSDDSISDEESLIEIAIPGGHFVHPDDDPKLNLSSCKLFGDINEMNEEDNLIEIDIYMGSIKCSRF